MKKNGQYVGVNEEFIPEEEKFVDNTVNGEIKDLVNDGVKSAKDYISNENNQEKIKKTGKKGLGFLKVLFTGHLVFLGISLILIIVIIVTAFSFISKTSKQINKTNDIIEVDDKIEEIDAEDFNFFLETYAGTKTGSTTSDLLDEVVTNIKKNSNYPINVVYEGKTLTKPDDITALKKELISTSQYEITFDYDSNGFINKVTISDY